MDISDNKVRCPIAIKWTIPEEHLLKSKDERGSTIESDYFKAPNIPGFSYYLEIHPNDDYEEEEGITTIHFELDRDFDDEKDYELQKKDWKKIEANYNISIESAYYFFKEKCTFEGDVVGTRCFKSDKFFNPEERFIVDGKITIKLDGFLTAEKDEDHDETWKCGSYADSLCLGLWNQADDKNVTIHADEKEITAHKWVLSLRSPVFAKMFESGMKEAKENKVVIEDFPFEIVAKAVELCYHQSLVPHSTLEDKMQLLQFFDKYDIQPLKADLEKYLISVLNELTVCRLTNAALISNAPKLEKKCTDFLQDCMKTKPIADFDILDKEFAMNLLKTCFFMFLNKITWCFCVLCFTL